MFSADNPYPLPDDKDHLIQQAYADACDVLDWDSDAYTLTDEDMKMVRMRCPRLLSASC